MTALDMALQELRRRAPNAKPRIAVVLGSGWGGVSEAVRDAIQIPYNVLEGFPRASVKGHAGTLVIGRLGDREVAVMNGRKHVYEEGDVKAMKAPLQTLSALGCEVLVQTNAAGSLDERMTPGSLMVLTDHINLSQRSPLVGENGSERFVNMSDAYDADLRKVALDVARRHRIELHEGVYLWCLGPQFETPAEIRMFRMLGANAVGMSTVPETILARRAGMRVLALSLMTNMAAGLSDEDLSHAHTLEQAARVNGVATKLLADVIQEVAL
jgi:purine-nucleoside phosphorylase